MESTATRQGKGSRARSRAETGHSGAIQAYGGLRFERCCSVEGQDPFDSVDWDVRDALITGEGGTVIFHQKGVEVPHTWSQMATNVTASKYFRGHLDGDDREHSVRQLVTRVVDTLKDWGLVGGYFEDEDSAKAFRDELATYLLHQKAAFNSPVWFNMGIDPEPQCSACFINSVEDDMESITALAATEARLFKGGSGTGTNLSPLRGSMERLNGGGIASGPVSFMKGFDAFAGVIKSGGKTRRAAKMVILDIDHPDIEEFINCKADEEKKAWALIDAGYDGSFNGEAYSSVFFQNSNNSVRVTDEFMRAVEADEQWQTMSVLPPRRPMTTHRARDLWRQIADAAWVCGDPGLQFDTTVNRWHTCPETDRINASNPCSEYMFLDNSACNLASLNLLQFRHDDGTFDTAQFEHCVSVVIAAQEIIVGFSRYPTDRITANSKRFRTLGIGYANLGALLMANGLAYDSDEGRAYAAAVTALLTGAAYRTSAQLAQQMGPFDGFPENRLAMLRVIHQHRDALDDVDASAVPRAMLAAARTAWDDALDWGERWGYRNAQVSVLAPTGTIGFLMDCDTTGVEPDLALVKYKKLVGGGMMKIVNSTVPLALETLGYSKPEIEDIITYIDRNDTIEDAPHLRAEHLPVFDCAIRPLHGERAIEPLGHLRMMGAVQPFLSGAISKTVNLPHDTAPEEIGDVYLEAWRLGVKSVALYRDGCKRTQPMSLGKEEQPVASAVKPVEIQPRIPVREKLPDERQSITHKFSIQGHKGYLTVGLFDDGRPGEIFIVMAKQGSTISGLMDGFATSISLALQYGVPLQTLCDKFTHTRFEPQGWTTNPDIPIAKSITDYIFRWLALKFLPREMRAPTPAEISAEMSGSGTVEEEPRSIDSLEQEAYAADSVNRSVADEDSVSASRSRGGHGHGHGHGHGNGNGHGHVGVPNHQGVEGLRRAAGQMYTTRAQEREISRYQADAPPCPVCGSITVRSGACYKCANCGATTGCS